MEKGDAIVQYLSRCRYWFSTKIDYRDDIFEEINQDINKWRVGDWVSFHVVSDGQYYCFADQKDAVVFKMKYGGMEGLRHGVLGGF